MSDAIEGGAAEAILHKAAAEAQITDTAGRVFKLKNPGPLAQYRLVEKLGGQVASNQVYMNMVMPLIFIASIDGDPVRIDSKAQLEALIQRLDEHGITAVMECYQENFLPKSPEEIREEVKN